VGRNNRGARAAKYSLVSSGGWRDDAPWADLRPEGPDPAVIEPPPDPADDALDAAVLAALVAAGAVRSDSRIPPGMTLAALRDATGSSTRRVEAALFRLKAGGAAKRIQAPGKAPLWWAKRGAAGAGR
jgi:hypothetical protein